MYKKLFPLSLLVMGMVVSITNATAIDCDIKACITSGNKTPMEICIYWAQEPGRDQLQECAAFVKQRIGGADDCSPNQLKECCTYGMKWQQSIDKGFCTRWPH